MINDKKFVNPYNFISLGNSKTKWVNFIENDSEFKTGYINISVTVRNSIVIPGQKLANGTFDYYHYPKNPTDLNEPKPIIPGSQLRGVVRSVYEALTNSCLSSINDDETYILSKRFKPTRNTVFNPYILHYEDGNWILISADKYKYYPEYADYYIHDGALYLNGKKHNAFEHVDFSSDKNKTNVCLDINPNINSQSLLHIGNKTISKKDNPGRRHAYVFVPNNKEKRQLSERDVSNLEKCIKIFNKNAEDFKTEDNYKRYEDAYKNKQDMTVYARIDEYNRLYISLAQVGRKMAYKVLSECYKGYAPCDNVKDCCPACSMFGFVNAKNASTGKVKFLDLHVTDDSKYNISVVDFVSLEPKVANFNFYSTKTDWDEPGIKIRGRKFYWHNDRLTSPRKIENEKTKSTFKVINKRNDGELVFTGRIYFRDITKTELQYLIFALCLGNDDIHMHKIGHAKPFGYGSVKIKCDSLYFRTINTDTNEFGILSTKQDLNEYLLSWNQLGDEKYIHELEKITNVLSVKDLNVTYPYLKEGLGEGKFAEKKSHGFSWFVEHPDLRLPNILSDDIGLTTESNENKSYNSHKPNNKR